MTHSACPFCRSARLSWCSNYAGTFQKSLEIKGSLAWITDEKCCVSALAVFSTSQALELLTSNLMETIFWQGNNRRQDEILCVFSLLLYPLLYVDFQYLKREPKNVCKPQSLEAWIHFLCFQLLSQELCVVLVLMEGAALLSRSSDVV